MRWKPKVIVAVVLVLGAAAAFALKVVPLMHGVHVLGGVHARVLLGPSEFSALPRERFDQCAVTAEGTLLLRSDQGLYEAVRDGDAYSVVSVARGVDSFVTVGRNLLVLRGDRLGEVTTPTGVRDVLRLPETGLRLGRCGTGDDVCVWSPGASQLMRLDPNGRLTPWITLTQPIVGVAPSRAKTVFVATREAVYQVSESGSHVAIRLPERIGDIVAVASDARTGELFFSTRDRVYAMRGAEAIALTQGLGGSLCFSGGALYVFDDTQPTLVSLEIAERRHR